MSNIYTLVKNDSAPQIKVTLTREDDGTAINFVGGSCKLKFRKKDTTVVLFTLNAPTTDDFANGEAVFGFSSSNLDQDAGYYEGEVEITYSTGAVETLFEILEFYLRSDF